jgi:hypothetical protein
MEKRWMGSEQCDLCKKDLHITSYFFDTRLKGQTQWALLCPACYELYGLGTLGTGMGQMYDGTTFLKMEG